MAKIKKKLTAKSERVIHNAAWISSQIDTFAKHIAAHDVHDHSLIVGSRRGRAELSRRVCAKVSAAVGRPTPFGALDVTLYRDDVGLHGPKLTTQHDGTRMDGPIDNRMVFLIDDVLCTGRTIRAALDELMDF